MFGFLTTLVTIILGISDKAFIIAYKNDGNLSNLIVFIATISLSLFILFFLSIAATSLSGLVPTLFSLTILCVIQLLVFSVIGINLILRSSS